jgi:hypothetical protein
MPKKIAVMLDGGHLRVYAKKAGHDFRPDYIERIGLGCAAINEEIFRILYYDCAPYRGTLKLPVSGTSKTFIGNDGWVHELAKKKPFCNSSRCAEISRVRSSKNTFGSESTARF